MTKKALNEMTDAEFYLEGTKVVEREMKSLQELNEEAIRELYSELINGCNGFDPNSVVSAISTLKSIAWIPSSPKTPNIVNSGPGVVNGG